MLREGHNLAVSTLGFFQLRKRSTFATSNFDESIWSWSEKSLFLEGLADQMFFTRHFSQMALLIYTERRQMQRNKLRGVQQAITETFYVPCSNHICAVVCRKMQLNKHGVNKPLIFENELPGHCGQDGRNSLHETGNSALNSAVQHCGHPITGKCIRWASLAGSTDICGTFRGTAKKLCADALIIKCCGAYFLLGGHGFTILSMI